MYCLILASANYEQAEEDEGDADETQNTYQVAEEGDE